MAINHAMTASASSPNEPPTIHSKPSKRNRRAWATATHLGASCAVAALAALFVFLAWYPSPFAAVAGVTPIFLMLVGIDVLIGPALTFVVSGAKKPHAEFVRDLAIIGLLQISALGYGVFSVATTRPVGLVFEYDLFRLVTASDIEAGALKDAPKELNTLSWSGPKLMAVLRPANADEQLRAIDLALAGIELAYMPKYWVDYGSQTGNVWRVGKPVLALSAKYPHVAAELSAIAAKSDQPAADLRYVPLRARGAEWVVLVAAPDSRVVGYLPVDGYF
jgi:hypothetical protein